MALSWRGGSEPAGLWQERERTLVRHIYDLHMTRDQYNAADTALLAHEVMKVDAETRVDLSLIALLRQGRQLLDGS